MGRVRKPERGRTEVGSLRILSVRLAHAKVSCPKDSGRSAFMGELVFMPPYGRCRREDATAMSGGAAGIRSGADAPKSSEEPLARDTLR